MRSQKSNLKLSFNHKEAQQALGISRESLDRLIELGYLPGAKKLGQGKNGRWIISRKVVEGFLSKEFPNRQVPLHRKYRQRR